jgi:hypothetical protein
MASVPRGYAADAGPRFFNRVLHDHSVTGCTVRRANVIFPASYALANRNNSWVFEMCYDDWLIPPRESGRLVNN